MGTCDLLDAVKARFGLPSDYAVAQKIGVTRSMMSRYRQRKDFLGDDMAVQVAELIGVDPAEALAMVHAERSKSPAVRRAFERLAKLAHGAAALFFLAIFSAAALSPGVSQALDCILCKMPDGEEKIRERQRLGLSAFGLQLPECISHLSPPLSHG